MRLHTRLLAALTLLGVGAASDVARAGISYDLIFRSTGTDSVFFPSVAEARSATVVTDVIMTTSNHLIFNSISVGFDDSFGLEVGAASRWSGLLVSGEAYAPIGSLVCDNPSGPLPFDRYCQSFNGGVIAPNAPPSLPPGTYHVGTIVWDTSSIGGGVSSIAPFITPGLDATAIVDPPAGGSGAIQEVTGTEMLFGATIFVIPEPGTAALLGVGLLGMVLAGRRRGRG